MAYTVLMNCYYENKHKNMFQINISSSYLFHRLQTRFPVESSLPVDPQHGPLVLIPLHWLLWLWCVLLMYVPD